MKLRGADSRTSEAVNGQSDRHRKRQQTGRKDMQHEKDGKSRRERECVWGDSLGLLQKRRRLTACDDWRLSVEKIKEEIGFRERERRGERAMGG